MSITLTRHESSAERLVEELPSPVALKVVALVPARAAAAYARQAVTATFVGSVTARSETIRSRLPISAASKASLPDSATYSFASALVSR